MKQCSVPSTPSVISVRPRFPSSGTRACREIGGVRVGVRVHLAITELTEMVGGHGEPRRHKKKQCSVPSTPSVISVRPRFPPTPTPTPTLPGVQRARYRRTTLRTPSENTTSVARPPVATSPPLRRTKPISSPVAASRTMAMR